MKRFFRLWHVEFAWQWRDCMGIGMTWWTGIASIFLVPCSLFQDEPRGGAGIYHTVIILNISPVLDVGIFEIETQLSPY